MFWQRQKARKDFFFEKKKQKTSDDFGCGLSGESEPRLVKVFCFFFSKKKFFLKPLGNPCKNRTPKPKLRRTNAHAGAVAYLVFTVEQIQNIQA